MQLRLALTLTLALALALALALTLTLVQLRLRRAGGTAGRLTLLDCAGSEWSSDSAHISPISPAYLPHIAPYHPCISAMSPVSLP